MDGNGFIRVRMTADNTERDIFFTEFDPATMIYIGPRPIDPPPTIPPPAEAPSRAALLYSSPPHTVEQEQECLKFAHAMQALAKAIKER
jgi:hypothetical protein